jgi:hypothetical protein
MVTGNLVTLRDMYLIAKGNFGYQKVTKKGGVVTGGVAAE